jgi:hypothetical protein
MEIWQLLKSLLPADFITVAIRAVDTVDRCLQLLGMRVHRM